METTTTIISTIVQENIALGVMVIVVLWLMRNLAAARREHRDDMHSLMERVGELSSKLYDLNAELVSRAEHATREIGRNREAINRELGRKGRPSIHQTPADGVPVLVDPEASRSQPRPLEAYAGYKRKKGESIRPPIPSITKRRKK